MNISPPSPLTNGHNLSAFDCGVDELNTWLKRRALQNQFSNATRTYVATNGGHVVAFHSLAAGSAQRELATYSPGSIPVILLARLAVDLSQQGRGIGEALLLDAVKRSLSASEIVGAHALVINAMSQPAISFYTRYGFRPSPLASHLLMATFADLRLTKKSFSVGADERYE